MRLFKLSLLLACSFLMVACKMSYRPAYHHTPEQNWMNDPNGLFYDAANHIWHLYYQHNPFATT